jgi:hypothetical protein
MLFLFYRLRDCSRILHRQTIEISKLKKEIEVMRENLKVYEKTANRKDEIIESLSLLIEKQREKADLQRILTEWRLKQLQNAKEVNNNAVIEHIQH